MKFKIFYLKNAVFLLLLITLFSASLTAQKKPTSLKLDVDTDDKQLCDSSKIKGSQFCQLYSDYNEAIIKQNFTGARIARNEMIEIVRGQVDVFYKQRKDGRSTKIRVFSTILDFLRIGGELAVTIMNGERAKTIVGAALSGLNSGQNAFNKNFQILQTQVLINKMNTNRANIMTEIVTKKALDPADYSWYAAKNDLRRYLFAGTFDNALDELVQESGAQVKEAEERLFRVSKQNVSDARSSNRRLRTLVTMLADPATKDEATKILREAVTILNSDDEAEEIQEKLKTENITASSSGEEILKALKKIRKGFNLDEDRPDLVIKINEAINEAGGTID